MVSGAESIYRYRTHLLNERSKRSESALSYSRPRWQNKRLASHLEDSVLDTPFPAYSGADPYIFVRYAHTDSDIIFSEISWLKDQGFNVWYDEGISVDNRDSSRRN